MPAIKLNVRKLLLPLLGLLALVLFFWMGWRFVQATHQMSHQYDLNTRLWQAAWEGQTALVVHLLGEGADANYDDAGFTVLQEAVKSGKPKTVAALLRAGADPDKFINDYSPLRWARDDHKDAIIALLKKAGATE